MGNCSDQAKVSFLHEIEKRHTPADKLPCHPDDFPQVELRQPITRSLVAAPDGSDQLEFTIGGQRRKGTQSHGCTSLPDPRAVMTRPPRGRPATRPVRPDGLDRAGPWLTSRFPRPDHF